MSELPNIELIKANIASALTEDLGRGDPSAALIPPDHQSTAQIITREDMVVCGIEWVKQTFDALSDKVSTKWHAKDGDTLNANEVLCDLCGPTRALLSGERVALNFLQLLSGTATLTWQYVNRIRHTQCQLLDTRKTIPGLRLAQKYAVSCGGGHNHRMGLFDAIMLKENHLAEFNCISTAVEKGKQQHPELPLIVEVETFTQLEETLKTNADRILLDNFSVKQTRQAVVITNKKKPLESSGNIHMDNIAEYAETGVDFISIGALTKQVRPIDLSMRITTLTS